MENPIANKLNGKGNKVSVFRRVWMDNPVESNIGNQIETGLM